MPIRVRRAPERLEPVWGGKTFAQAVKETINQPKIRFGDLERQKWKKKEVCHHSELDCGHLNQTELVNGDDS